MNKMDLLYVEPKEYFSKEMLEVLLKDDNDRIRQINIPLTTRLKKRAKRNLYGLWNSSEIMDLSVSLQVKSIHITS